MRRWLLVALGVLASGCGSSTPASPSGQQTPGAQLLFAEAPYAMLFRGTTQCDLNRSTTGTNVSVVMRMRREGTGWTGANGGTLSLHLESAGAAPSTSAIAVTGTLRGFADDEGVLSDPSFVVPTNGTRMTVSDDAAVTGSTPQSTQNVTSSEGTVNGTVIFSRDGVTSSCPPNSVTWTLSRRP